MIEKTTIGGTTYDSIGSSSSNLLLKCNGNAKIQWGGKLIDLIKNGKLAIENNSNSNQIFIVSNESEIKLDGIYVITEGEIPKLCICKNGQQYKF